MPLGLIALTLAPGLAIGIACAEGLRRNRLRWTWAAPFLAATLPAAFALASSTVPDLLSIIPQVAAGGRPTSAIVHAAVPLWVLAVAPTTTGWKLWRDRHDRLHGGERARRLELARRPLDLLRAHRHHAKDLAAGPVTTDGILLGTDPTGAPVRLPRPKAHVAIVGGSNSGKTNTAEVLLEAQVAAGGGFVVLDGKGGRDLPRAAVHLAAAHGRPVALWSIAPYNDGVLDAHRMPWNAAGDGAPTEIKDRIASSEEQAEPYYKAIASRGLLMAAQALARSPKGTRLDELARLLEQPDRLRTELVEREPEEARWLATLTESERSALRGIGTRLGTMVASEGGAALLPDPLGRELVLHEAVRDGWLVVFSLPQGAYPELIPHVARYALSTLNGVCTRIEASGRPADGMVFVDELSAFDGEQLCAGFERGRSAGVRFVVATQSLSNFAAAGGDKLLHAALDNAELLVVHRQAVPDAAELLASIGGTEEAWEHTHQVAGSPSLNLDLDETGVRARRLTDQFRAHPNEIKRLGQGEAIIVAQRPSPAVRRLLIRPGLSARS